jgi:2,3-bisphosphoglycerate-independent phosphoglycerate mutase
MVKPLVLIVMDGIGVGVGDAYDAVAAAPMPFLQSLLATPLARTLRAHGQAVGLPSDDDMGNSEVGHNAIGAGRIIAQGVSLVDQALSSGEVRSQQGYQEIQNAWMHGGTLHLIGLLSDGGVHSRQKHFEELIRHAVHDGCRRIRLHILTDGRDVQEGTAEQYVEKMEVFLAQVKQHNVDARIASGGGRMFVTMDRYEADWSIVERGWQAHVLGKARQFDSAAQAIATMRKENPETSEQYFAPFVIAEQGKPIGMIHDGDAVVMMNFRGDRAVELSRAFVEDEFQGFERERKPKVIYAGMMQYDGDTQMPPRYLVSAPVINNTLEEHTTKAGLKTFAISETQKYGHVTYFWNGNRSGKYSDSLEVYKEIPSRKPPYEAYPAMCAREITEALIPHITSGEYAWLRCNYANGDMVGHTGNLEATKEACRVVDEELKKVYDAVMKVGGTLIVTADHGNADDMVMRDKKNQPQRDKDGNVIPRPSHTLAPVPFVIVGNDIHEKWTMRHNLPQAGLANIAATVLMLLGLDVPKEYEPALIEALEI